MLRSRFHTLTWLIAIVWASWTQILSAQEEISFDIETWLNFSSRAERVVTNQAASDEAFLNLQSQLVVWKNAAQSQLQPTQAEIARITGRIEALAGSNQKEEEQSRLNRLLDELNGNLSDAEIRLGLITDVQQVTNGLIDEINNILATRSRDRL